MGDSAEKKIDESFGKGSGIVLQSFGSEQSEARKVLVQPDNKIIAVGFYSDYIAPSFFALARYQSNGTIDSSFGENGLVITDMGDI